MGGRRSMALDVKRKVYFYRIDLGLDEDGRPILFDPKPVLEEIDRLPFDQGGDPSRYMGGADTEDLVCCWVDAAASTGRLRLATSRRSGLPQQEHDGDLDPLGIPQDSGLAEQIHVRFFPDNVVGSEFNFYGPRISKLRDYIREKVGGGYQAVRIQPLIRPDVMAQLEQFGDVRLLDLRIKTSFIEAMREADESLAAAFRAAEQVGEPRQVAIQLQPEPYGRHGIGSRVMDIVKRLARHSDVQSEATRFKVKGHNTETDKVETVDVLKDKLVAEKRMVRQEERTRALAPSSAYAAIEEAYHELEDQIRRAAAVDIA